MGREQDDRNTAEVHTGAGEHGQSEPSVMRSEELFRARRELVILHDGQEYRLRLTRQNKLILTK